MHKISVSSAKKSFYSIKYPCVFGTKTSVEDNTEKNLLYKILKGKPNDLVTQDKNVILQESQGAEPRPGLWQQSSALPVITIKK